MTDLYIKALGACVVFLLALNAYSMFMVLKELQDKGCNNFLREVGLKYNFTENSTVRLNCTWRCLNAD